MKKILLKFYCLNLFFIMAFSLKGDTNFYCRLEKYGRINLYQWLITRNHIWVKIRQVPLFYNRTKLSFGHTISKYYFCKKFLISNFILSSKAKEHNNLSYFPSQISRYHIRDCIDGFFVRVRFVMSEIFDKPAGKIILRKSVNWFICLSRQAWVIIICFSIKLVLDASINITRKLVQL